jgi:hypothetical protein
MKSKSIISITVLLLLLGAVSSCDNSLNTDIEQTLSPYLELDAIDEASNTTLTIRKGAAAGLDSYFAFDVSNVQTNGIISEGLVEGWCLEWNKPIASNNDRHDGVEAYSTFGSDKWKPVNYLMSIKNKLKREDPSLTYKEVQVSIWSLIDVPQFNLDEVLAAGKMPSRMMSDGRPNFSVSKVKEIVERVRSNADAYTYSESSPFMVFARTDDNSQNGGFVPCESGDADQCEGFVSISGSVYVDANSSEEKDSSESGIQNTTVTLTDDEGMEFHTKTEQDGFYSFIVYTGDDEKSFTLEISEETEDTEDFNEGLFDSYLPTTPTSGITVMVDTENSTGINFGFEPQVENLIERFNSGEIETNTETRKFWAVQLTAGFISEATGLSLDSYVTVPKDSLILYLSEIENLFLDEPFQFGEANIDKLFSAWKTILRNDTDLDKLLAELITAELNVVSGRGSGSLDFDLALLAFGESSAFELNDDNLPGLRAAMKVGEQGPDFMPELKSAKTVEDAKLLLRETIETIDSKTNSVTTRSVPVSSFVVPGQAEPLLRSFNFSGGGGGSVGPAE